MKVRFLPPDEWSKLADTPLGLVAEQMSPDSTEVLVVEDEDGRIIGTWADMLMLHLEGFWTDPEHRAKGAVFRLLLKHMFSHLRESGCSFALTAANTPDVANYLERFDARPLDVKPYILPIPKDF